MSWKIDTNVHFCRESDTAVVASFRPDGWPGRLGRARPLPMGLAALRDRRTPQKKAARD
ncbi:hypothetical protein FRAHR75_1170006 [Frankia sp. Hr75.2]|nr:hypothetical protein FRAHR75_1170006 [Frankia sp. Hr75.2]